MQNRAYQKLRFSIVSIFEAPQERNRWKGVKIIIFLNLIDKLFAFSPSEKCSIFLCKCIILLRGMPRLRDSVREISVYFGKGKLKFLYFYFNEASNNKRNEIYTQILSCHESFFFSSHKVKSLITKIDWIQYWYTLQERYWLHILLTKPLI